MTRLAVDKNVLARAIVDDGSERARRSRQCFIDHEVFVPDTVLLETEWVLRSRLGIERNDINRLFSRLIATPSVRFDDVERVGTAIVAHAKGIDFADAMHLLASAQCDALATFDEQLIKRQGLVDGAIPAREP
jgi:predicted nucleic-acid-binding protein